MKGKWVTEESLLKHPFVLALLLLFLRSPAVALIPASPKLSMRTPPPTACLALHRSLSFVLPSPRVLGISGGEPWQMVKFRTNEAEHQEKEKRNCAFMSKNYTFTSSQSKPFLFFPEYLCFSVAFRSRVSFHCLSLLPQLGREPSFGTLRPREGHGRSPRIYA